MLSLFSADLLGGVLGLFLNPISRITKGIVTMMASSLRKFMTFCCVSASLPFTYFTINPAIALPDAPEIRFMVTAVKMMTGITAGLNQLLPRIDDELKINIQPIAQKTVPKIHHTIVP